ncbi:hypothetical protein Bequi_08815 [Brachybacterium sp. JHP9]|uniref:Uncharacterized protein n=1 Tax=Brachybacterium equifaecis TaxID=2910770 RepID=A0ABT0R274_9MICO|nr:hypothetical protein [Brachybacterium equifaecis]MCL6423488.1 hypothetical protein [Brachybacterium equifaecis]
MLLLGIVLGFLLAYFLVGWGGLVVLGLVIWGVSAVFTGRLPLDGAIAGALGLALGYGGIMLVALFRGGF